MESHVTASPHLHRAAALILAALATAALADCPSGVRPVTAAESDFATKALAALAATLPATPQHMERQGPPFDFRQPAKLAPPCKGSPEGSFETSVSAGYLFKWPKEEAARLDTERKKVRDEMAALKTLPPDKAAQYKDLVDKSRAAYNSQPKAKRGGPPLSDEDRKLAEQKVAEGKAFDDRARALVKAHEDSVKPQLDALTAKETSLQSFPQQFRVVLAINAKQLPASAENVAAFGAASPKGNAGLKVTNAMVVVDGPAGRPRQVLFDAIDKAALQALVGKPLPSVAQSEAASAALVGKGPAPFTGP